MKRFAIWTIATLVSITVIAGTISTPAEAGRRGNFAAGLAIGAIGGALIVGGIHRRHYGYRRYRGYRRPYGYRYRPRVVYRERVIVRPRRYHRVRGSNHWQRHVARCYRRYRSYDHRSDTFVGYDGRARRCRL